jgi:ComEC/Rec2-related protein
MVRKYPAVILLAGVVLGIAAADILQIPAYVLLVVSILAAIPAMLFFRRNTVVPAAVCLIICLSSVAGYRFALEVYDTSPRHYTNICSESVRYQLFGTVVDWPDIRASRTNIVVQIDSVGMGVYRKTEGLVLVAVSDTGNLVQRGDRIEWYGELFSPKRGGLDKFDYRRYLNLKGIAAITYLPTFIDIRVESRKEPGILSGVDHVREWIVNTLWATLTPSSAALAQGFLIGETRHIPQEIYTLFRDTGTLHVLAVSGSNVGLVILFLYFALFPFPLKPILRSTLLIGAIVLFAMVSYGEPSVARASLMAILIVTARLLQRRVDLNQIVALTALLLLLWQPSQFFDVGFQLSFVTAWGIVYVMTLIENHRKGAHRSRLYYWIVLPIVVSLVAQVFSAPLTAYYFGRVPAISLLANITVVPLISVATVGTLCVLLGSFLLPLFGQFLGGLLSPLMAGILSVLQWFDTFQWPMRVGENLSPLTVLFLYTLIVVGLASIWYRPQRRVLVLLLILWANVAGATTLYERLVSIVAPPAAFVSTIPGGIMVILPRDNSADVIISGSEETSYDVVERVIMPALESRMITHIDRLIIHSADAGAIDGLMAIQKQITIDSVLYPSYLTSAVTDVLSQQMTQVSYPSTQMVSFGATIQDKSTDGLLVSSERVEFWIGNTHVLLSSEPSTSDTDNNGIIILTGKSLTRDQLELFHKETNAQVICAEMSQGDAVQSFRQSEERSDLLKKWLYILSERGGAQIVAGAFDSSGWLILPAK